MANILVCDDDKEIVEAISIYLSQEGYQIFKARKRSNRGVTKGRYPASAHRYYDA